MVQRPFFMETPMLPTPLLCKTSANCATLVFVALAVGCSSSEQTHTQPPPPDFRVESVENHHDVTIAHWIVTIRNEGGPGTMLFTYWIGDMDDPESRKIIYEEQLHLDAQGVTTRSVKWEHGIAETFWYAYWYGGGSGATFYAQ